MPDWTDTEITHRVTCQMRDPVSLASRGWLEITGATVSEGYYSDTRIGGTVTSIASDDYVDLAMLQLHHSAMFRDGSVFNETLGTFFVDAAPQSRKSGRTQVEFSLKSALWGLSVNEAPYAFTVGRGSRAGDVFDRICNTCRRQHRKLNGYNNHRFGSTLVWDAGETYLSHLFSLTDASSNRVDVAPDGYITLGRYTSPASRQPSMRLAWNSPLVLASGIERSSDELTIPGRTIVTWDYDRNGKTVPVIAYTDVKSGHRASLGRRGFLVTETHRLTDRSSSSASEAENLAHEYIKSDTQSTIEWQVPTRWFSVHEGDVISWKPSDTEPYRKVLVKNVERDLRTWLLELTLKEV